MPQQCRICTHPERTAIDQAIVGADPKRRIAAQYSVKEQSVRRHAEAHLPARLVEAASAAEGVQAEDLLQQVESLKDRALGILATAEDTGDLRTALSAIRETRAILDLLARLLGEIDNRPQVNVLVASPEWQQLRSLILSSLEPFPKARQTIVNALETESSVSVH